jgi:plasmid stabilization system protein ParE
MNLPLCFEPEVREDIDEAYEWYEGQRIGLGEEFLAEVDVTLDRIQQNPELSAPIYQSVRRARFKRFAYALYYRVEPRRIVVIAVHHGKRDPKHWQSRI